jgi:uncharacterized membrane protein
MIDDPISPSPKKPLPIEDASSWILRGGLVVSLTVMLVGILFSFVHGTISVSRMAHDPFDYHPSHIWQGIEGGRGKSIIEAGIYLLLLTPIMRVAVSAVLFAFEERDWFYTAVTATVLLLVLAGLLWFG